jgi:pyrimidine-specific ribonucleoside hydrolase
MIALLATLLLGIAGQVARYRAADPLQRRRSAGFLTTLAMLPIWILVGVTGVSPVLNLALGFALLALLPAGLLLGVARGLWGGIPEKGPVVLFAGILVAILLVSAAAAGSWWRANQPIVLPASALNTVEPQIVVVDTDMGMDDISALLYLLQHPAVDLRAITVNGVAFAHCGPGVHNVLGLLEVARAPEIPVSCGREEPYPGGRPAPDGWRKGADNLYGGQVRTGNRVTDPRPAAELLVDTIASAPGDIVIVALGPLTNLAEAFEADPSLAEQVKRIVIMGGAVDAPGNVASEEEGIDNAFAEWNIFADPVAADIVLSSCAPITLVPLDATNDVPFTRGFYERLRARLDTRPATFVYNLMYMNQWWLDGGMYWWDTLAAAAALDESLVTLRDEMLDVVTEAGPEIGRTFATESGSLVQVAVAADARQFEALFLEVLNHER